MKKKNRNMLEKIIISIGILALLVIILLILIGYFLPRQSDNVYANCLKASHESKALLNVSDKITFHNACAKSCSDPKTGRDYWNHNEKLINPITKEYIDCPPDTACFACAKGEFA